jgi:hypothetical protein
MKKSDILVQLAYISSKHGKTLTELRALTVPELKALWLKHKRT